MKTLEIQADTRTYLEISIAARDQNGKLVYADAVGPIHIFRRPAIGSPTAVNIRLSNPQTTGRQLWVHDSPLQVSCRSHIQSLPFVPPKPSDASPDKALCKHWLYKKECSNGDHCDLSHIPSFYNTPHCLFNLQGRCNKSPCAFAHVDIDAAAPVCESFSRLGYCNRGADCTMLHVYECPEFANYGTCSAGNKCISKHKQRNLHRRSRRSSSVMSSPENSGYMGDAENVEEVDSSDEPHAITQQHDYVPFGRGD
ncbi:unnamed protein product [Periconia digitata]|uniref:C3H1-type domain-containing protein n=1 Tax=Periconia digitata TaxID=1303443 RepID=A0A9W4U7W0_9PLEO|nr:unnamed protein product [Periconia digitata]